MGKKKKTERKKGHSQGQEKMWGRCVGCRGEREGCVLCLLHHIEGIHLSPSSSLSFWGGEDKVIPLEAQSGISNHPQNIFSCLDPWVLSPASIKFLFPNSSYIRLMLFSKQGNNMAVLNFQSIIAVTVRISGKRPVAVWKPLQSTVRVRDAECI